MKTELDKKIEKETTFLFNGIQFRFRLDDYTRECGYLWQDSTLLLILKL